LNLDGDSRVYGGVALDAQKLGEFLSPPAPDASDKSTKTSAAWRFLAGTYTLVDLPLSLVGDTLTLPITIPTTLEDREDREPAVIEKDARGGKATDLKYLGNPYPDSAVRR
jgi:uncharacterized protein YceK